jgi:hypothetical protein
MLRGVDGERLDSGLDEGTELGAVEAEVSSPPSGVPRSWAKAATAPRITVPPVANIVPRFLPHHDIAANQRLATQTVPQRTTASLLLA